jgi:DNA-binding LacI/PurR family transcriptional regulator
MSLVYGFTGTTSFEGIRVALDPSLGGEMAMGALIELLNGRKIGARETVLQAELVVRASTAKMARS